MVAPVYMINGVAKRRVDQLQPGDRVDLEGDAYADPWPEDQSADEHYAATEHREFAFEFETVLQVVRESADCIRVDFESGLSFGFPPDHLIDVDGEQ